MNKPARWKLGISAVRKAVKFGTVTYQTGGCTQLLAAKKEGWLRRDMRFGVPTYRATPAGKAALAEHEASR